MISVVSCKGIKRTPSDGILENDITAIRDSYKPFPCFRTSMQIEFTGAGGKTEKGKASLHADYKNDRMYLVIKDPLFGIEVVRLLKNGETIKIWNLRTKKIERIPLSQFELRGLGNNTIRFPFNLFQNFIYGSLPDELFDKKSKIQRKEGVLFVKRKESGSEYEYEFQENRLRKLTYTNRAGNSRADVKLEGLFRETIFPETVGIVAGSVSEKDLTEKIQIKFSSVNQNAKCDDRYFQMR